MHAGKLLIVGMFAVGLVAASAAWWHRLKQSDDALAFWTPAGVATISRGSVTGVAHLAGSEPSERELDGTPGLPNMRHTLLQDLTFAEPIELRKIAAVPAFTLRFTRDANSLAIHFDEACDQVWKNSDTEGLALQPQAALYFRNYIDAQFAEKAQADQPAEQ
jgi:hypothetical protein